MVRIFTAPAAFGLLLALAACNPYTPADRADGGAAVAAGGGAGVGATTGILTTPPPPPPPPRY